MMMSVATKGGGRFFRMAPPSRSMAAGHRPKGSPVYKEDVFNTRMAQVIGVTTWLWIMYRCKQDYKVKFLGQLPWEAHGDH